MELKEQQMCRVCPHCGYQQEDYEVPVFDGKTQCRKCRKTLAEVKRPKRIIIIKAGRLRIPAED